MTKEISIQLELEFEVVTHHSESESGWQARASVTLSQENLKYLHWHADSDTASRRLPVARTRNIRRARMT